MKVLSDKYNRTINYARISITDRCNLRCRYCMPAEGIANKRPHDEILSFEELYSVVMALSELGVNKVRITGGEPMVRLGVVDFIERINSIESIKDTAITTNGLTLLRDAEKLRNAGLKRLNISLDTLDDKKYSSITRGGSLTQVLKGIEEAKRLNFEKIKINTVLIGGFNDDEIEDFVNLTMNEDIDVRFIELMPIGECAEWSKDKFLTVNKVLEVCDDLGPTEYADKSSPAVYYKKPGALGRVGLIEPISCKFCSNCNRIRITSDGKLKTCLHSNAEYDLKPYLNDLDELKNQIQLAVNSKEKEHKLEDGQYIKRNMVRIGG